MSAASDFTLNAKSRIAVIGGGPSGALFSYFALRIARMVDKQLDVTIFEPKAFTRDGPVGCNRCGGVISEHLVQTLAIEGINIPPEVLQCGIDSYVLHTQRGDVFIKSPAGEKRIATVYRGGGPKGDRGKEKQSFDNFLLQCAIREGATHSPLRIDGIKRGDRPIVTSGGKDVMDADLVVGAFGVNSPTWKVFEGLDMGYRKPKTTTAFIAELELGSEEVAEKFDSAIHFFLMPKPENVKFAALIPKGKYVTLCILGKDIQQDTVTALVRSPFVGNLLPANVMDTRFCMCFPKLALNAAKGGFSDRTVVIGDAGSTRLFKDGIGAAYTMGKAAAATAVLHGVGKAHFSERYLPVYNRMKVDNLFGRLVYMVTNAYKNVGPLTQAMVAVVEKEQQQSKERFPRLSSMLWDTFTGNETYRSIFMRGTDVWMHAKLVGEVVKALVRRST